MSGIKDIPNPNLIVGFATSDDAAVYKIREDLAIVQTLDFITPLVEDPFIFGQIAAANALSDVYAMGGTPLTAMNICCFPSSKVKKETLAKILEGGFRKVEESGASLVGGHTIDDPDLKYGLSVTGIIDPQKVITNKGARISDRIILTKPLGTAMYIAAHRAKKVSDSEFAEVIDSMTTLNRRAGEIMLKYDVSACTDVTGFALSGHLLDVAEMSQVQIELKLSSLPIFKRALELPAKKKFPTRLTKNNQETYSCKVEVDPKVSESEEMILYDPQTSGGLLIFIKEDQADQIISDLKENGIQAASIVGVVKGSGKPTIHLLP